MQLLRRLPGYRTGGFYSDKQGVRIAPALSEEQSIMKTLLLLLLPFAAVLSSCQPAMPAVPDSGRKVVGPAGSSEAVKSWSTKGRQEGEAALGPLGNISNRR